MRSDLLGGLALVAALVASLLSSTPARADACGGAIAPPTLTVRTDARPPTQDHSRGVASLSKDGNLAVPRGLENFRYAVGVTAADATGHTEWDMQGQALPDGRQCWWITQAKIIATVSTRVFIAKEIPRGSCLWNEVVKHEAKHVHLDQQLFPKMSGLIRPRVLAAISHSVVARSQAEARTLLGALLSKATRQAVSEFQRARDAEQLKIDTAAEYSRPNKICGEAAVSAIIQRAGPM
ncbi:hypothetical protein [Dongia sp.]|uniref:hypothetical protein n=1 Tax=Dongia sp. TaxID=1977262 RepID=UPI0035B339B5